MKHFAIFLITLWCSFQNMYVLAQSTPLPNLSQLHLNLGYMPVIGFSPKKSDYIPKSMYRMTIGINYGKGYIKYNGQYTVINSTNVSLYPDAKMLDNSLGYSYFIPITKYGFVFIGAQLGLNTYYMDVAGTNLSPNRALETELSSGFEVGMEIRIKKKLGMSVAFKQQRIFATPRNDLSMVDLGLTYYFNSTPKLKKWLD